jgi:hypothetical protein
LNSIDGDIGQGVDFSFIVSDGADATIALGLGATQRHTCVKLGEKSWLGLTPIETDYGLEQLALKLVSESIPFIEMIGLRCDNLRITCTFKTIYIYQ